MRIPLLMIAVLLVAADEPPGEPAVTIRLQRPDLQLERLIALFQGSRAPDPAAALALWKQASPHPRGLGKATEAAIATLNPRMIHELAKLDDAEFVLDFAQGRPPLWSFSIVRDDGTFSAFATAMALTDGASEPPLDGSPVDRLGPPGSALMVRVGESIVLGSPREFLPRAVGRLPKPRRATAEGRPDSVRIDLQPSGLARSGSPVVRGLGAAALALGWRNIRGGLALTGEHALTLWTVREAPAVGPGFRPDPRWFRELPARASIAFSATIDPAPEAWDRLFLAADRVEKADPSRSHRNPLRPRLNLLARAAGLNPERDLWPKLRGVSGFLLGELRTPRGGALALHAVDDQAAAGLRAQFLPALARALRLEEPREGMTTRPDALALVAKRPLFVPKHDGPTVWIVWGPDAYSEWDLCRRDASATIGSGKADPDPGTARVAWIWPGRLGLAPAGSTLQAALAESPPIYYQSHVRGGGAGRLAPLDGPPPDDPEVPRPPLTGARPRAGAVRPPTMPKPPPRLIDLHTDWLLQYAPETDLYDEATALRASGAISQAEGYLGATSAAVIALYRDAEDWARRPDPWRALGDLLARAEAEFSGRILIGLDDLARWRDDPDGLTWAVLGVEGFDFLIRDRADLNRLPDLFARGVRVFQPIYGPSSPLGGSSAPRDERTLTGLGRDFLEAILALSPQAVGPRPALDLAHMNPATCSDVLDWFEADSSRSRRVVPLYSHGALAHEGFPGPRAITAANLARLRALGGTVGFGVSPPFYESPDQLRRGIEAAAAMAFKGRPGYEGIALGTDFLGVSRTLPGLRQAPEVREWVVANFVERQATAILRRNAEALLATLAGAEGR